MRRWLPAPLLSAALFVLWLMLQESLSPGHLLLGAVLALVIPVLTAPLRPAAGPMRRPLVLGRLILMVGVEVVVSALQVGRGVLRSRRRPPRGRFVVIPLELRDEHALAALAVITAVIPGTVWCELAPDRSALLLHVFDVEDEAAFIDSYKRRYERPLQEIFE
ncbi:Na+/H+ antiporter subunit E [Azohydromonas caseinilytica]|uniref:Na+/H+ antiporter subunit E n=1 Tax=Azohydromonas caseinilytica TaxID=2728836 RepID=A0A848FA68_9BURK|nr:Na+/H+ antiporter subunit E [Azohydromonas caseinilytica]NML15756.1 Na+/H+ antiporter subunit E [Azohydromonas caseinilytica]